MFLPRQPASGASGAAAAAAGGSGSGSTNAFLQMGGGGKQRMSAQEAERRAKVAESLRPWVEKYRPKSIDDVVAQEHTVNVLRRSLLSSNLPHMLFYGGPGTGKTSTILALAHQLFGPELFRSRVLELNASDERGISVVREKIKNFAKLAVSTPSAVLDEHGKKKYPCPPFKIIILDEADSMTQDAQSALRRIMEQYSHITRFCLVCNYVTRIIEPLTSRCSKFRFRQLDSSSTRERLQKIAAAEGVTFADDKVLDKLIEVSDGDLRRSITYLQSASRLHGATGAAEAAAKATPITTASILEIAGRVPAAAIRRFAAALGVDAYGEEDEKAEGGDADGDVAMADAEGNLAAAARAGVGASAGAAKAKGTPAPGSFSAIHREVALCTQSGYGAAQLLSQLHDYLMKHPALSGTRKAGAAITLGLADKALVDGGDEELQLLNTALQLAKDLQ
ncbi:Subunit of heteropentameric Replication factor C (RF-C) [Tilletia horrida]|nr:Subunit of heteropentameric Replication factor C (RF-C) [Tilletia horrida]